MKVILRLFPYLRPYRFRIVVGAVCLFLAIPCQLFHPLVWKFIVDTVIVQNRADWLLPALAVMFVVYILGTVFSYLLIIRWIYEKIDLSTRCLFPFFLFVATDRNFR